MPIVRFHRSAAASLSFAGGAAGLVVAAGVVNTARVRHPGPGLLLWVLLVAVYGAVWLAASSALPHPPQVPLRGLVPGAILFAVGTEALHLLTVVWYGSKLEHSSELYGGLGAAVVLLAWLYLLGRLAITGSSARGAAGR